MYKVTTHYDDGANGVHEGCTLAFASTVIRFYLERVGQLGRSGFCTVEYPGGKCIVRKLHPVRKAA